MNRLASFPAEAPRRGRGRLQLLLILAIVLLPMLLASAMYRFGFWVPDSRNYDGVLVADGRDRAALGVSAAATHRWELLVTAPDGCAQSCRWLVYLARQIHIGLARDATRAGHALASAGSLATQRVDGLDTVLTESDADLNLDFQDGELDLVAVLLGTGEEEPGVVVGRNRQVGEEVGGAHVSLLGLVGEFECPLTSGVASDAHGSQPFRAPDRQARERYSPVRVSTLMTSPGPTNNGTCTTKPVSSVAGLRAPDAPGVDDVERIGIERAWGQIAQADALVFLHDLTRHTHAEYQAIDARIEAELAHDRRVNVGDVVRMLDGVEAEFVGAAVNGAAFDATAGHPDAETIRMMIAAIASTRMLGIFSQLDANTNASASA